MRTHQRPTPVNKPVKVLLFALAFLLSTLVFTGASLAADTDGCLNCHQYRGLARESTDGKSIRAFYVDPSYYNRGLGPHARLKCTDCHIRDQVAQFPHKPLTPVDCSKACHLESPGKVETRFSHDKVAGMLKASVHGGDVLAKSNELLGKPLNPGQAGCLLCHDEPVFSQSPLSWTHQDAPVARCNVCHDEQLPQNTQFAFLHVSARTKPARSSQDVIKVCGMCHSNAAVREAYKLPDATASYLASFHGKAILLGSTETASCLDCHVGQLQNVHLMKKKDDPQASTNPQQLPATCRTPTCHPAAGQRISTAAIHLNLPTSRGVEFFIACVFVFLIVFTFGPSLAICSLKMLQIVVGRKDEHHEQHVKHVAQMLGNPQTRKKLTRFNAHQRVQHWFLVLCFATLVVTGFPIKFAESSWAASLISLLGGLPQARKLHRWAGALLVAGFVYHLIYILLTVIKNKRAQSNRPLWRIVWDLPMMVRPADGKEMLDLLLYMLFLKRTIPAGEKYNAEEKFEYIGVFWGTIVLGTTGILMWANAYTARFLPGRILTIALLVHTFEAFLALLHVGIVHMAGVIFSPTVFPMSKAMFTGETPAEELVHGHGAMLEDVQKELDAQEATNPEEAAHV